MSANEIKAAEMNDLKKANAINYFKGLNRGGKGDVDAPAVDGFRNRNIELNGIAPFPSIRHGHAIALRCNLPVEIFSEFFKNQI